MYICQSLSYFISFIIVGSVQLEAHAERSFKINYDEDSFTKDGEDFRYISGSIHYARVPSYYWEDRLLKMYTAGLNVIQTYVPWNVHEPVSGTYDFEGQQDLVTFLQLANKIGLLAVVRAGPYMCGEWEFGGLPSWILKSNGSIILRSMDPGYIKPVDRWLDVLLPKLKPLLYQNGGPIILTQLENEYGSFFTCDMEYREHLRDKFRSHLGSDAVLITTDGAGLGYLKCGAVDGVYATVDFGPGNATAGFAPMRQWNPKGPLVNSEFYTGWLDHWGEPHAHTAVQNIAKTLEQMLTMNASVNFYMFIGGTNFGYMNGANAPFNPVPTSYDYDAPLSEAGDITTKYTALREVIGKYRPLPQVPVPPSTPKYAYGTVCMDLTLPDAIPSLRTRTVNSTYPLSMEQLDQSYGVILYEHVLQRNCYGQKIQVSGLRDRANVCLNGKCFAVLDRAEDTSFNLVASSGDILQLFVENLGRINFGKEMLNQRKGIISNVTTDSSTITEWSMTSLNFTKVFDHPSTLLAKAHGFSKAPAIYVGHLVIPESTATATFPMDSYISMPGWFRGQLLINGINLGRYWPVRGPQETLYVPKGVWKDNPYRNVVMLVEFDRSPCYSSEDTCSCHVDFHTTPFLNGTVGAYDASRV